MRDEGEAKVRHEENDGADTQRLGKEPAVIQPEGESRASGLHLSWVGRQLDLLTSVALSLELPEERSGGGRQVTASRVGAGRGIQTEASSCFIRGLSRHWA